MSAVQEALLANCALPGCHNIVDQPGDACEPCQTLWGRYIARHGELSPWHPGYVPACHHGFNHWRTTDGCGLCGCTEREWVR